MTSGRHSRRREFTPIPSHVSIFVYMIPKNEKLTEKFLLSLVSSITTTICSHNYHLLLLLLFITISFKLLHLPTYQHHSYLELAISLQVKTIYSCHVSIPPFMEHPLSNFQNPNYKIVQTLDDDLIFIATIISLFKICFSAAHIIFMSHSFHGLK